MSDLLMLLLRAHSTAAAGPIDLADACRREADVGVRRWRSTEGLRAGAGVQLISTLAKRLLQAPVHAYRWTLKPLIGWECRHLPTCSEYALEAIETNGAWRGGWLALSRVCRCHPWGTSGFDPPPDIRDRRYPLAPWRYGRWR